MSCAAGSGGVASQRAAGAAEAVVECDGGGQGGEAAGEADAQLVQDARAVAFEAEDVLGGEEDRFDALADRREVRSAPGLVLAARRTPQRDVTRRGGGHGGVDVADPRRSPSRRSRAPSRRTRAWRWCSGARSAEVGVAAVTAGRGGESRGRPFAAPRSVRRYAASRAGSMPAGAVAASVV